MRYRLVWHPSARKDLRNVPDQERARILVALAGLVGEPLSGKKLSGEYEGSYSLRVWPYRIIYMLLKNELVVMIVQIGQRGGVYK